jgi:hypothetical protein
MRGTECVHSPAPETPGWLPVFTRPGPRSIDGVFSLDRQKVLRDEICRYQ